MDNHDIKAKARLMAGDIQNIIDSYNRLDPEISFFPIITMTKTTEFKGFSVEVEVSYNTKQDGHRGRQFTQVDTSTNAYMEGKK